MRKSIAIVASMVALTGVLGMTGCGSAASSGSGETVQAAPVKNSKAGKADAIKADDIEVTVEDGFWYDERKPVMTFTNNSDFDVITVDIEWSQKQEMTPEQRSAVFAEFMDSDYYTEEDIKDFVINAYKEQLVAPGETSLEAEVCLNNMGYGLGSIDYFELFEPSFMKVAYLGGDGKAYLEYIDFKTGKTKDASKGGKDVTMWSDSDLAKRLPKIEAPVCIVSTDDEDAYWFETLGMTIDDFDAYVEKLKKKGFDQVDYEDDDEFRAHDKDGYEMTVSFNEMGCSINGHLDTDDVKAEGAASSSATEQVSADFKSSMDEYELFFDEYIDFMKSYKDGGAPTEMVAEYTDYMTQYAETMAAFSNIDSKELSAADAAYLLEVQGRINSKIASI